MDDGLIDGVKDFHWICFIYLMIIFLQPLNIVVLHSEIMPIITENTHQGLLYYMDQIHL